MWIISDKKIYFWWTEENNWAVCCLTPVMSPGPDLSVLEVFQVATEVTELLL